MASNNSHPRSKEEIHKDLIDELIDGHVGYDRNAMTYNRWRSGFENYCTKSAVLDGNVKGHFEFLENTRKVSIGNYRVLEDIFREDRRALQKIQKAIREIENLHGEERSVDTRPIQEENSRAFNEPIGNYIVISNRSQPIESQATNRVRCAKIKVPIITSQHNTAKIIAVTFRDLINDIQQLGIEGSPIEKGYNIAHGKENWTSSSIGQRLQSARNSLVDKLRNICSDKLSEKVESIFKIWFNLFHILENRHGLSVLKVGWVVDSIIIVVETDTSIRENSFNSEVESHIRDIFSTIGQNEVFTILSVEHLLSTDKGPLFDQIDRPVV